MEWGIVYFRREDYRAIEVATTKMTGIFIENKLVVGAIQLPQGEVVYTLPLLTCATTKVSRRLKMNIHFPHFYFLAHYILC